MKSDDFVIEIVTPQFERPAHDPPQSAPPADWAALHDMSIQALKEIGLRAWNDPDEPDEKERAQDVAMFGERGVLMLLPGEWYRHIPMGYSIVSINGAREEFEPHITDNDIRFGCLAYGIVVRAPVKP